MKDCCTQIPDDYKQNSEDNLKSYPTYHPVFCYVYPMICITGDVPSNQATTVPGFNGNSLVTINAIQTDIQNMRVASFTGCFYFLLEVWKFL